jgi:hypothetical protein
MAKSSRGGMTVYEKQDMVIAQFERINRTAKYSAPTLVEQIIAESKIQSDLWKAKLAKEKPQPYISHYNPDNILNRTRHLSAEDRKIAIKQYNKEQAAIAKSTEQTAI